MKRWEHPIPKSSVVAHGYIPYSHMFIQSRRRANITVFELWDSMV